MKLIKLTGFFCFLLCISLSFGQENEYSLGEDSKRHDSVPRGVVTKYVWKSTLINGTIREYYLYVPAQ